MPAWPTGWMLFFVDSTLFLAILINVGRHDVQGVSALALILEWIALGRDGASWPV